MQLWKYALPLIATVGFITSVESVGKGGSRSHDDELNERDVQALREYLDTRREVSNNVDDDPDLEISGDVRTEWRHLYERKNGVPQRGRGVIDPCKGLPVSHNDFDIEFNLRLDYATECAWAAVHIQYDNSAGIDDVPCFCILRPDTTSERFHGSGICDDLCLKRAYMGYNIFRCPESGRLDVELGRRILYDIFESEIQFLSRFDGLLFTYSNTWECVADWYWKIGGFLVDERTNHFAWATEVAFFNICDSGFDFKYSFIDWVKRGRNRCFVRDPIGFRYRNSQWTFTYHLDQDLLCFPAEVYGAFLVNHAAKEHNWAWYAGFTLGKVEEEGDWAVDVQYQWVQRRAVAWDDQSGIGLLNTLTDNCCPFIVDVGYKGWRIDGLYAITDNLTINPIIEWATQNGNEGVRHSYSKFELEAIYAF